MGKFETYPETNTLNDNDITLYNHSNLTNKITFATLVSLIRNKLEALGFVSSVDTGAGLTGGAITSSGTIKCKLQSETLSSLQSISMGTTINRQYAVGLDSQGNLSVNVPWVSGNTYQNGDGVLIDNDVISIDFDNTHTSTSTIKAATANSVKVTYDDSMRRDGNNANNHVCFNGAFTVGNRNINSVIGTNSTVEGNNNTASGISSHAEGVNTEAIGNYSHAGGYGAVAPLVSQFVQGGYTYKFNNAINGRGVFGIQPNGEYYTSDTTITDSQNGCGGTGNANVTLTLQLSNCALYMLYCVAYESGSPYENIYYIATHQNTSGAPSITSLFNSSEVTVYSTANNQILITDNRVFMFHLVRII